MDEFTIYFWSVLSASALAFLLYLKVIYFLDDMYYTLEKFCQFDIFWCALLSACLFLYVLASGMAEPGVPVVPVLPPILGRGVK